MAEFKDKMAMAEQIQKLYKSGRASLNDETVFLVLMQELKEYNEKVLKPKYSKA
jgi:hypothetical protein